jgi:hypothetical protein
MRSFIGAFLLVYGLLVAGGAYARVDVAITESGSTVTVTSSGTLLSNLCSSTSPRVGGGSGVNPSASQIGFLGGQFLICDGALVSGSSFGAGPTANGSSNTGAQWAFDVGGNLYVPSPFTSLTSFANSFTISGSISSLGMTPGTYTYTVTNGPTSDTIVVTITAAPTAKAIPTLSEWTQMLLALMVLTMIGWHFHRERSY